MRTASNRTACIPVLKPGDDLHTLGAQFVATYSRLVELNAQCDALPEGQSYDFDVKTISPVEALYDQLDVQLRDAMEARGLPLAIVDWWLLADTMSGPVIPDRPLYVYPFKL
jgi:hypothetical protein